MEQLTKNFTKKEFDSKCGREMPENVLENIKKLAENVQIIRDEIGKPIKINSGYRSPEHNKKIGGVSNSQHVLGCASDLSVNGMTSKDLHKVILKLIKEGKIHNGGVGLYPSFVHYDIRKNPARW